MVLTTLDESQAPEEARYLLQRNIAEKPSSRAIIELVTTIMVYKFEDLSEALLDFTDLSDLNVWLAKR